MMPMTCDEKKNIIADHFGAIQSYVTAIKLMAQSLQDQSTACAFDMIADSIGQGAADAQGLFDELMEGETC